MKRNSYLWVAALVISMLVFGPLTPAAAHPKPSLSSASPTSIECQTSTREYDNIQVNSSNNPFYDDLGNQWVVYYDLTRDAFDNALCNMRVVMRVFNPSPDGSWKGTAEVFADVNNAYDSYSYGKVSGSGTYAAHFVWRGPWSFANAGSYHIVINEFNGSTVCLYRCGRASTDFSL